MKLKLLYSIITYIALVVFITELWQRGTVTGHSVLPALIAAVLCIVDMMRVKPEEPDPVVHTVRRVVIIEKKGNGWKEDII